MFVYPTGSGCCCCCCCGGGGCCWYGDGDGCAIAAPDANACGVNCWAAAAFEDGEAGEGKDEEEGVDDTWPAGSTCGSSRT